VTQFESQAGELLKKLEGFRDKAYWDVDKWAIGYGFREGVVKDQRMSKEEANARLLQEINPYASAVEKFVTNKNVTNDQKAALTSFAYNVGIGALQTSTLLKKLNAGDIQGARAEFARWSTIKKRFDKGLYARRMKELAVFDGRDPMGAGADPQVAMADAQDRRDARSGVSDTDSMMGDGRNEAILARLRALASDLQTSPGDITMQQWLGRLRQEASGA
jgi:lysozyme